MSDLDARVASLEHQMSALRGEMHGQIVDAAHALRQDDKFMQPASQKFVDHASDHMLTKAGRKLLLLVIGVLGAAIYGLVAWLTGRGFTP